MNNNQGRRRTRRARQLRKQKNTQISRILLTICMMALVAVVSIGGTMAWLTDNTAPVVNTFTNSDVDIELTETDTTLNNNQNEKSFKMVPGTVLDKDPTVTVYANSEDCYVFVKVDKTDNLDTYIDYVIADGWDELQEGVYYREVNTSTDKQDFPVIGYKAEGATGVTTNNKVLVKTSVTKELMDALEVTGATQPTLTFTAYAVQKANLPETMQLADIWALAQTNGAGN